MTPNPLITLRPSDTNWLYGCTAAPGYIVANAHRIPPQDTEYSVEGTLAHTCAENYVLGKKAPKGASAEMKQHARAYADFVEQFKIVRHEWLQGASTVVETDWAVEDMVDRFYQKGRVAKVDFRAITPRKVTVIDLKYGAGVAVNAKHNKQLAIYGRGVIEKHMLLAPDELEVEMHIWQPRIREGDKHSTWTTTWGELRQWTDDEIAAHAEAILKGGTVSFLESDKTCRFCPARKCCDYRDQQRLNELPDMTAEEWSPPVLDNDALARVLARAKDIKSWLDDKLEYAQERAIAGDVLPGFKVVLSKGAHRTWTDEKAAAALLRQKFPSKVIWTKKLTTPAKVEEALDSIHAEPEYREAVLALMYKPPGSPVLAPLDDKRPEYRSVLLDELPDLTIEEEEWI